MSTAWTYGAELEWPDVDTRTHLPAGWSWSETDYTIVNSTGIANDPKRQLMRYGGELNTPTAPSPERLAEDAAELWDLLKPGHNYRSNLHIHVRIPGLGLGALKAIAAYTRTHLPAALRHIDPLDGLLPDRAAPPHVRKGAHRRLVHSRRSRHHLIGKHRHLARMQASTIERALEAEVPQGPGGTPQWHLEPREAVNLRSLRKHGTIELRCFAAPLTPGELAAAARCARDWLAAALDGDDPARAVEPHAFELPRQWPYDHRLETGWERTNLKNNKRADVARILAEEGLLECA